MSDLNGKTIAFLVAPEGIEQVSYVATLDIPTPGAWQLDVRTDRASGTLALSALDPGGTAPLGAAVPTAATLTAADVDSLRWLRKKRAITSSRRSLARRVCCRHWRRSKRANRSASLTKSRS